MTLVVRQDKAEETDLVTMLCAYLQHQDETVRCAAARALAAQGDQRAAASLVERLLDEDPDVRSDAMAALVTCARPEDADAVRRSLMGDPVKEVKVFAIQVLARLGDSASTPLLQHLVRERCDQDVAWEDELGVWDDWLDVQIEAIKALGAMKVSEAIPDILAARADELAQDLDSVANDALIEIGDEGLALVIGWLQDPNHRIRTRAVAALAKAQPGALVPWLEHLVSDPSADVRRLAAVNLDPCSALLARLAKDDPEAEVRIAALKQSVGQNPDLAVSALNDADEAVRALALKAVVAGPKDLPDLAANVAVWLLSAGSVLATVCAESLPQLQGPEAKTALSEAARNEDRPLEVRIAALTALGKVGSSDVLETLLPLCADRVRQLRAAALSALAETATAGDDQSKPAAAGFLAGAIRGALTYESSALSETEPGPEPGSSADLGVSKAEQDGPTHLHITPDGEIVQTEEPPDSKGFPKSTLESIETLPRGDTPAGVASDDGSDRSRPSRQAGKRRRVAVDGPSKFGRDIRLVALRVAAGCPGAEIEDAIVESLEDDNLEIRRAAFAALAERCENGTGGVNRTLIFGATLSDSDAFLRSDAARVISATQRNAPEQLTSCLGDSDPTVRSIALKCVASETPSLAIDGLEDRSSLVRSTALDAVLEQGSEKEIEIAIRTCLQQSWTHGLSRATMQSAAAWEMLQSLLADRSIPSHEARTGLQALAATRR